MNRLETHSMNELRWRATRACAQFFTALVLFGCGAQTSEPDVDGQSHWWTLCSANEDCADGFRCSCGACTRVCTASVSCDAPQHTQCSLRAGFCDEDYELAELTICQVVCNEFSDCPGELVCHEGICVSASIPEVEDTRPTAHSDVETDSGVAFLCGEPPTECPPPPEDWCTSSGTTALPKDLVQYWSSFCDAGVDASVEVVSACGDGILQGEEACDDGNSKSGDGCTSDCAAVEVNFDCATAGEPCQRE